MVSEGKASLVLTQGQKESSKRIYTFPSIPRPPHFLISIYLVAASIQLQAHSLDGHFTLCHSESLLNSNLPSHLLFVGEMYVPKATCSEMKTH